MVSLDIAEKRHEEQSFCALRVVRAFFGRPVRGHVRGATSRIMKFDAKDK